MMTESEQHTLSAYCLSSTETLEFAGTHFIPKYTNEAPFTCRLSYSQMHATERQERVANHIELQFCSE